MNSVKFATRAGVTAVALLSSIVLAMSADVVAAEIEKEDRSNPYSKCLYAYVEENALRTIESEEEFMTKAQRVCAQYYQAHVDLVRERLQVTLSTPLPGEDGRRTYQISPALLERQTWLLLADIEGTILFGPRSILSTRRDPNSLIKGSQAYRAAVHWQARKAAGIEPTKDLARETAGK